MKKIIQLIALLLIVLAVLCACTTDSGSGGEGADGTTVETGGENNDAEPPSDTWENAQGQSGVVEYEYDGENLTKAVFRLGDSDKIWRTVEYSTDDVPGSGTCWFETHRDANGTAIFRLEIRKHPAQDGSDERFPSYISGYDSTFGDTSSDITYTVSGQADSTLRKNTYSGAQKYWITEYGSDALPEKTTVYYRDGVRMETWRFFDRDGKIKYAQKADDYTDFSYGDIYRLDTAEDGTVTFISGYATVTDDGNVSEFAAKDPDGNAVPITVKYDGDGNVTERTYPVKNDSSYGITQTYTCEGGKRVGCKFVKGHIEYDNVTTGAFVINPDGTLASADYSYLNGGIGSGDTTYFLYEYYDSGVVSRVIAYDSSEPDGDSGYCDLEWEKEFSESGKLKMECTYDSYDMTYREKYFDENGERTHSVSGSYTDDGQKTPEGDA